jgi:hypothetical protein
MISGIPRSETSEGHLSGHKTLRTWLECKLGVPEEEVNDGINPLCSPGQGETRAIAM